MEESIEACDTFACGEGFDVFEKRAEPADYLALIEAGGDLMEGGDIEIGFGGARCPDVGREFLRSEFAFKGGQHAPFEIGETNRLNVQSVGRDIGSTSGFESAAADMTNAEGKEFASGHESVALGSDDFLEIGGVFGERVALRHFECGPKAVLGSGCGGVS